MSLLLYFLISFAFLLPQQGSAPIKSIGLPADYITTDRLGNLYAVKNNFLWKYNSDGDSVSAYNTVQLGPISSVDATDPYKILVFYKTYGILQFLDNFLSQNASPIYLHDIGFDQVELACNSSENGFWVYDPTHQKIKKLNSQFRATHETMNLLQWFGRGFQPNFMIEYNQKLYVNEPTRGILVFDQFATYIKTIPLLGLESPQIMEDEIFYHQKNSFCRYGFKTLESNCVELKDLKLKDARYEKNRLYLLKQNGIEIRGLEGEKTVKGKR